MTNWLFTPRLSLAGLLLFALFAAFGTAAHLPGWAMGLLGAASLQINDWIAKAFSDDQ